MRCCGRIGPSSSAARCAGLAIALFAAALAGAPAASAQSAAGPAERARQKIDRLLQKVPAQARVAVVLRDADDKTTWYERLPDEPLKPASVLKLFVSAAAVQRLGADFAYDTALHLSGDELWVRGAGDPALGDERLDLRRDQRLHKVLDDWADALKQRGVTRLSRLVLDDSIFDREGRHPDWPADQYLAWYQAPCAGINFNGNCLDSRIGLSGDQITIETTPALPGAFLLNQLRRGKAHDPAVHRDRESDVFVFRGSVARSEVLGPVSVARPEVFFGHALSAALSARGIVIEGPVVRRALEPQRLAQAALLARHRTPLPDVLWRVNTFSQNLFADCLLKTLSAYEPSGARGGQPGSWSGGARRVVEAMAQLGVNMDAARIRDGSGLSHENRVSAAQVVGLLAAMKRHRDGRVFIESLASAGDEGTMRSRYGDPALEGRLIGKTGSIRGVQTLAGYLRRADGRTLAFAILINDYSAGDLAKQICKAAVEP